MSFYANIIPNFEFLFDNRHQNLKFERFQSKILIYSLWMRPSANYWHDANDEGMKMEIGTETDRHELEVGRVMTMVKFYSNFKLVRKVTLVDPFGF